LSEAKTIEVPAAFLTAADGSRYIMFTAADAEKVRLHCQDLASRLHKSEAENAELLEANRKLCTGPEYHCAGRVQDQPVFRRDATASPSYDVVGEILRHKETIAGLTNRVKSVCAERDQLNAECHRVTAIAEQKILELHTAEVARDELRRRNDRLIAQRDEAFRRLNLFGAVLAEATFALNGEVR
jgi:hypothetical protein